MWNRISRIGLSLTIFTIATLPSYLADAAVPPTAVGQCAETFIDRIGTRLEGVDVPGFDPGTSVLLTNGVSLVDYETVQAARDARPGDRVLLCLAFVPANCPPGDTDRGKIYTVFNYRTQEGFSMPNSEHTCGGA